jgi:hypothetical protein
MHSSSNLRSNKQSPSDDVSEAGRNDTFPDVQADANPWSVMPNACRDEKHVRDNMIESERHESEGRPPDT